MEKTIGKIFRTNILFLCFLIIGLVGIVNLPGAIEKMPANRLTITTKKDAKTGLKESRGYYRVFENRVNKKGKILKLGFTILHAKKEPAKPDPLFLLAGGPGVAATIWVPAFKESPVREDRDIVFVNLRGTADNHRLFCDYGGDKAGMQGHLDSAFRLSVIRKCLENLQKEFDLTQYSNPIAIDDLEEVKQALGYKIINLIGFSGGTRAALIYMRRHPDSIRTAILNGMVPLAFTNPLYHASASQRGLELLFAECAADPACQKAFPNIETEFNELMHKLQKKPVTVSISHPKTKKDVPVKLDGNDFSEAVRMMLYRLPNNRKLPYLIHRAYLGEFQPFAQLAVETNRGINNILSMGLLLCVTCAEDVDRITEEAIIRETRNTFLGDVRVREQKAACGIWPRSKLPEGYSQPIKTDIPVLILSGSIDPVTPPRFGKLAAKNMPNALHLVVPGTHGVFSPCQSKIELQFLNSGTVRNLNTDCIKTLKLPPLFIPESR